MTVYEIPLSPKPQVLSVYFPNGGLYTLRLLYLFTPNDCWALDVSDALGNPLLFGVPLITGTDLFAQFAYLGFGCQMTCTTDGDPNAVPRFYNLGISAHLLLTA